MAYAIYATSMGISRPELIVGGFENLEVAAEGFLSWAVAKGYDVADFEIDEHGNAYDALCVRGTVTRTFAIQKEIKVFLS